MAQQPAVGIFNLHVSLEQPPELERTEVHVPNAVVDLLEANVFADAHGGDIDPAAAPRSMQCGETRTFGAEDNGMARTRKAPAKVSRSRPPWNAAV